MHNYILFSTCANKDQAFRLVSRTVLFHLVHINPFGHYFRIKQEWNFILECRKKGIPQSKYLKNGFVDTDKKILDTYGKSPQPKKRHTLSDEANKERNKFIFQLSGEQWTVNIMENMFLL